MAEAKEVKLDMFSPLKIGDLTLSNRVVMASLTRNRTPGTIPDDLNAEYYGARADCGLIISEGALIEPQGTEWPHAPGLWSSEHAAGWKKVTDAVHAKNGLIFAQLWHLGRVCHPLHQCGQPNVGPSAIAAKGGKFRKLAGEPGYVTPKAIEDPKSYVLKYKQAAVYAKEAAFDGVELHAANGYLAHQFLESHSNQRTDNYGGSIENRARFVLEAIDELISVYGPQRVGIKLSPGGGFNDMGETKEDSEKLYSYLVAELDKRPLAYIQLFKYLPEFDPVQRGNEWDVDALLAKIKNVPVFLNGGYDRQSGNEDVASGKAAAIVFGRPFIGNPDLVYRLQHKIELAESSYLTWYVSTGSREEGYTDYPVAEKD